ncbi:MAG: TldD/PmbA family protein [Candidatus Diapherotrites archaeon]|nr:TldD/PmbA family protein [Candidatus Diapherotrites archaeon]
MHDTLERVLNNVRGVQFIEINAVENFTNAITIKGKEVKLVKTGSSVGFGVRVLRNNSWGFAASNRVEDLEACIKSAKKLAKVSSKRSLNVKLAENNPVSDVVNDKVRIHPSDVAIEDKVRRCRELSKHAKQEKHIMTTDIQFMEGYGTRYYLNSEGADIVHRFVRSSFVFEAFSKKEGKVLSADERDAGHIGVEILDGKEELVDRAVGMALLLLQSELPSKGRMPVVIDPKMAGVLAHEAIGHACEADTVLTGKSVLEKKMNCRIGSRAVTIVDDATLPKLFGSYPYDAEGTKAQRKVLVNEGRLKQFLHSRETAAKMNTSPTGNARAQSTDSFPIVRMSNTFFERGDASLDELFSGIKRGIYVHGMRGGVTETNTGYFQFAAEYGYLIENGEKTKPLRDIVLVGNILRTLKRVEMASKEFRVGNPGLCGKAGQYVPVSDGGPYLRIGEILVGG